MTMKRNARRLLHKFGYDIHRFETSRLTYTRHLLRQKDVSLVLDVGANQGQYASQLRSLGYKKDLWSFEPGTKAFKELKRHAAADSMWKCLNLAVGDTVGSVTLHIAGNSVSSSLLPMEELHEREARGSAYVSEECVAITTLDALKLPMCPTWLKIDTQGSELQVLLGGTRTLPQVEVLQIEVSMVNLYYGQAAYGKILPFISSLGFVPAFVETAMQDKEGRMLQAEALFIREGQ